MSGNKEASSSLLEKLHSVDGNFVEFLKLPHTYLPKDSKTNISIEHTLMGAESSSSQPSNTLKAPYQDSASRSKLYEQIPSLTKEANSAGLTGIRHDENGLIENSLPYIFGEKLSLSSNGILFGESMDTEKSNSGDGELEDLEARAIGYLLPDDDDLLAGAIDGFACVTQSFGIDHAEDDLFCSGGGMELEVDNRFNCNSTSDFRNEGAYGGQNGGLANNFIGKFPCDEHPTRTLLVRNIHSNVDDINLRVLFEQYGDIRSLHTACKRYGLVVISYCDIRAAQNAARDLQNKRFRCQRLDITFLSPKDYSLENNINHGKLVVVNLDSSLSDDDIHQIFGAYGEIIEICQTPNNHYQKIIEFYDVRAAEVALSALNGCDIAGKRIKIQPSWPCGASNSIQQSPLEPKERQSSRRHQDGLYCKSPSECSAFRTLENASCALHGHQYSLNNSSMYHQHPPSFMLWQNSPPFVNTQLPHVHGLLRGLSHMSNSVVPLQHQIVGSASAVDPSLGDQRHTYADDCVEAASLHPGSLGSMGFSSCSQLHSLECASHNIFPHATGNGIDPSMAGGHVKIPSQRRSKISRGRTSGKKLTAYGGSGDRIRSRRSNRGDNKKQYELDIDRIVYSEDSRTTLMFKNIPNKYTSKMLLATIDEQHKGTYDFIYLPIDFKNKCNVGYAFINMIDPQHIIPFYKAFHGKKWEKFNSKKVASLAYARIQGKAALIAHFQNSSLMNEDTICHPILFHSDGPNAGDQEPFPLGANIRSRRSKTAAEINRRSPSSSSNDDEASSLGSTKDM